MKSLGLVFAVMLAVSTAVAQHGGGHSGGGHSGGGGSGHSGGSGGFHGSGGGGSVSGHGGYSGGGGRSSGRSGRVYIAPAYSYGYYVPIGYGAAYGAGGYGSGYADTGNGYAAPPPVEDAPPPPQAMDFGPNGGQPDPPPTEDGALRIYTAPAPSPQDVAMSEGRYYLIAYKDHSVYTALAFWMENGALNYVTPQNAHNQVSLDRLDMDLTKQLNSRHGMAFNIATP